MSDLVGNPEDRFSHHDAKLFGNATVITIFLSCILKFEAETGSTNFIDSIFKR